MLKTHLRNSKNSAEPSCHVGTGQIRNWVAVSPQAFKQEPPELRCSKCEAIFIRRRNQQRKIKNLLPIKDF